MRIGPNSARMGPNSARMGPNSARMGPNSARMGPNSAGQAGSAMVLVSRYSSKPATPISRPRPDCL